MRINQIILVNILFDKQQNSKIMFPIEIYKNTVMG